LKGKYLEAISLEKNLSQNHIYFVFFYVLTGKASYVIFNCNAMIAFFCFIYLFIFIFETEIF